MRQGTISPNTAISSETAIAVFGNWTRLHVLGLGHATCSRVKSDQVRDTLTLTHEIGHYKTLYWFDSICC